MQYICPKCHTELSEEDLEATDYGAHENVMGAKVWKPCLVYTTPCCGVEPIDKEEKVLWTKLKS